MLNNSACSSNEHKSVSVLRFGHPGTTDLHNSVDSLELTSASSSKGRNFFPCLCFGLLLCWFRAAELDLAFAPLLPLLRCPLSLEKGWVCELAGLLWPEEAAALDVDATDLEGMGGS